MAIGGLYQFRIHDGRDLVGSPSIEVKFTTVFGQSFTAVGRNIGGDILSVQTSKSITNPAGTFKLELLAKPSYESLLYTGLEAISPVPVFTINTVPGQYNAYRLWEPGTLVDIYINDKEVMLGMVDSVTKTVSIGNDGKPQRIFSIMGRDLGSILIDYKIWWTDNIKDPQGVRYQTFEAIGQPTADSPTALIQNIITSWFLNRVNQNVQNQPDTSFKFADNQDLLNKFIVSTSPTGALTRNPVDGNYLPVTFQMIYTKSDLWNYIKMMANEPFMELYVDTGDCEFPLSDTESPTGSKGRCYLVYRNKPYDNVLLSPHVDQNLLLSLTMDSLVRHEISDYDVASKSLTKGRNSIPTVYQVFAGQNLGAGNGGKLQTNPLYDYAALKRYGHNPMEAELMSLRLTDRMNIPMIQSRCESWQKKLASWFCITDMLLSGSLTIRGNPAIRIGQRLDYVRTFSGKIEDTYEEGIYYTTGVSQLWSYGGRYETQVQVDRGTPTIMLPELNRRITTLLATAVA